MKHPFSRSNREGVAIPLVCSFVLVIFIFFTFMDSNRKMVRKQNLSSYSQKMAYYMALGGIQHALLKFRILQRPAYDAAVLSRGICPFVNAYKDKVLGTSLANSAPDQAVSCRKALDIFMSDLKGSGKSGDPGVPFKLTDPDLNSSANPWKYEVASLSVLSYYTAADGTIRITMSIGCYGHAYDKRVSQNAERVEFVKKEIYLEKKLQ